MDVTDGLHFGPRQGRVAPERTTYDGIREQSDVTAITIDRHSSVALAGASLLATLLAGAMIGSALTVSIPFELRSVLVAIAAAFPVGLALAGLTVVWPRVAMLALVEVLGFAAVLLATAAVRGAPDPLGLAIVATVIVGAVAVLGRRARPTDVLAALLVGYASVAVIFEVGIALHNV